MTAKPLSEIFPDHDTMVANILTIWAEASPEQMADGKSWYTTAHHLAVRLDPERPYRAAGVISALSPRVHWGMNVKLAVRTYAEGLAYGCLGNSARKANEIYNGDGSEATVQRLLKAPKTSAFAATIYDPQHPDAVVVDRHAQSIAMGRIATDDDFAALSRKGAYALVAQAYRAAAEQRNVLPSTVQAVTWVVWRETRIRIAESICREAGR